MEDQQASPTEIQEVAAPVEEAVEQAEEGEVKPTENVKNFWERLDDVFKQNTRIAERMDELVEQFPEYQKPFQQGDSSLFQPTRISLNSKDAIGFPSATVSRQAEAETISQQYYNTFRIRLQKACVGVKSTQLLSAIIPTPLTSIPYNENIFLYYEIFSILGSSLGAYNPATPYSIFNIVTDAGNYYYLNRNYVFRGAYSSVTSYARNDIVTYLGDAYYCLSATTGNAPTKTTYWVLCINPQTTTPSTNSFFWNLIGAVGFVDEKPNWLSICPTTPTTHPNLEKIEFLNFTEAVPEVYAPPPPAFNRLFTGYDDLVTNLNLAANDARNSSVPNQLTFFFNQTYQKIQIIPQDPEAILYYMPLGFADPNIARFYPQLYQPMNVRLGFTWNGVLPGITSQGIFPPEFNPFEEDAFADVALKYLFPNPNYASNEPYLTLNTFPDILNTSACMVYVDFVGGSTQDSEGQGNLLSVVPLNTTQLGVAFYQNNFSNPLSKIPSVLTEFNVVLKTDKGFPYLLPNRATVLLELAVEYK